MSTMTLRLDEELQQEIDVERKALKISRSMLVRQAVKEFLERRAQRRFMAEMQRAARQRDPAEDRAFAQEALHFDNEALSVAEGDRAGILKLRPQRRSARKRA